VTLGARIGIVLIRAYQVLLGGLMGGMCRFEPSCSHYALEAIEVHGLVRGALLAARRLARCHPWGGSGFDPIPPKTSAS
jgi:putative membrane protein insertion efficiency factor